MLSSTEGHPYPMYKFFFLSPVQENHSSPFHCPSPPFCLFFCSIFVRSLLPSSLSFRVLYFTYLPLYLVGCSVTFSLPLSMRLLISGTPNFIFHYSILLYFDNYTGPPFTSQNTADILLLQNLQEYSLHLRMFFTEIST